MTPKAFQKLALSLPDAHEEPHFERTSFRVGKKIFATMTPDGAEVMVRVGSQDLIAGLLSSHGDVFFAYGGFTTRSGALGVRLAKVKAAMLEELLVDSWKHSAGKKAVLAFEGGRTAAPKRRSS